MLGCWPFEVLVENTRGERIMITPKVLARVTALIVLAAAPGLLLWAQQKSITVEGYVLDSACAFTKNLDKPISRDCALACAKNGSRLGILWGRGPTCWPVDGTT